MSSHSPQQPPLHSSNPRAEVYQGYRKQIDLIDDQLLQLLNERAQIALDIGKIKRANGETIYVPEREQAILERLNNQNPGPLSREAIQHLFQSIIEQVRTLEQQTHP